MTIHLRYGQLTMTLSPRNCHIFKLLLIVFLVTTTSYYLFFENPYDVHDVHNVYRVTVMGKKSAFINDVLENEIDGPYDDSALAALCSGKKWTPGLIFKCETPRGGIGNVRNVMMTCTRYAIEAGAAGFIVPEIMVRGPTLTELHTEHLIPFTYFFDLAHFVNSLSSACPHMHMYNHQDDLWDMPSTASPVRLLHPQLTSQFHTEPDCESIMLSAADWTDAFHERLNASHPTKFSESRPVLVSLQTPLLQWPIDYDEPSFIASFGRIFKFREDVRKLAATVLYAMNQKYQLGFNPEAHGIQEGLFYGAHLRTASDATSSGWTPYAVQSQNYISHAAHNHLPLIYVASGSPPDILQFADQAANYSFPMEVTTKNILLEGKGFEKEREELSQMTWDQQGLVDYEVMLRASRLGGTWESSFGWNLAMRRHVAMGRGTWVPLETGVERVSSGASPASKPATITRPGAANPTTTTSGPKKTRPTAKPKPATKSKPSERRVDERADGNPKFDLDRRDETMANAENEQSRRELPAGPQAFSDAYSIIFGDVDAEFHPGLAFALALWP